MPWLRFWVIEAWIGFRILVLYLVNLPAPFPESGYHTQSRCGEGPTARSEANHYN